MHFEELHVGDTVITEKHLVTLQTSRTSPTSAATSSTRTWTPTASRAPPSPAAWRTATSSSARAAGLFVDPPKGPVLLNYGIEEAASKPVYPGMTIQVKFTVKEKVDQEKKDRRFTEGCGCGKGIVKFLVDVVDETGETVAVATILTMVKKLDQRTRCEETRDRQ
jgi:oxepin-CoA hydrolase/3-oxo-5,6-dehydrosuberyl-CoA semialdehyde dehydrogenase